MSANVSFSCSDIYNVSGSTYAVEQEDGGIPENLGLNFAIWLVRRPWWRLPLCLARHFRVVVFFIYIYIYIQLLSCVFFFSPNFGPVYFVAPATTFVMLGLEGAVSVNLFILYHNGLSFVIAWCCRMWRAAKSIIFL